MNDSHFMDPSTLSVILSLLIRVPTPCTTGLSHTVIFVVPKNIGGSLSQFLTCFYCREVII